MLTISGTNDRKVGGLRVAKMTEPGLTFPVAMLPPYFCPICAIALGAPL
jgi:hypothetical protein